MFRLNKLQLILSNVQKCTNCNIRPAGLSSRQVLKQSWRHRSYKAAILEEFDKPLVVTRIKNDTPLGMSMIRMNVKYCSLNITDVTKLPSSLNSKKSEIIPPVIPGCEFSGDVLEVNEYVVENIKVGDKVVAFLDYDHQIGGGLAEESVVSELDCFNIGSVSQRNASLLLNSYGTAFLAFTKYCELKENDIVILIADSTSNGIAAMQIAHNVFQAKVYAICANNETSSLLRDEGAQTTISVEEGLSKVYKFLETSLKGKKAKAIYDTAGSGLMFVAADFVDPDNGSYLSADPFFDAESFESTKPEFKKSKNAPNVDFIARIKHVNLHKYRETDKTFYRKIITETLELCEEELITPHINKVFGLEEINEAVAYLKNSKHTGQTLIDVTQVKKDEKDDDDDDDDDKKK